MAVSELDTAQITLNSAMIASDEYMVYLLVSCVGMSQQTIYYHLAHNTWLPCARVFCAHRSVSP